MAMGKQSWSSVGLANHHLSSGSASPFGLREATRESIIMEICVCEVLLFLEGYYRFGTMTFWGVSEQEVVKDDSEMPWLFLPLHHQCWWVRWCWSVECAFWVINMPMGRGKQMTQSKGDTKNTCGGARPPRLCYVVGPGEKSLLLAEASF